VGEAALIDFQQAIILAGDVFVPGSVGLTAHVADAEIEAAVSNPPKEACQSLLAKVLERGGTDNVTLVIVQVHGRPDGQSSDAALSGVGSE
jgi:serine/threonine protein phosphatase PrpC